jgi:hypothetical protein
MPFAPSGGVQNGRRQGSDDRLAVDALVTASAARRGDVVYTSDFEDLDRLRSYFPTVRVLSV